MLSVETSEWDQHFNFSISIFFNRSSLTSDWFFVTISRSKV